MQRIGTAALSRVWSSSARSRGKVDAGQRCGRVPIKVLADDERAYQLRKRGAPLRRHDGQRDWSGIAPQDSAGNRGPDPADKGHCTQSISVSHQVFEDLQ